jgi:GDP/UDP-N,N'-diacetylbacillosamine 2-epimerase (hydrolysing)
MHPETLNYQKSLEALCELLEALSCLKEVKIIFTKANADMGSKVFNEKIKAFTEINENSVLIDSFGQLRYFSCMKYVNAVIGNSSSGILEAPSFAIPTINIGDRQRGRIFASSVINIKGKKEEILSAIKKVYTKDFNDSLKNIHNPYQKKFTSKNIVEVIKNADLKNLVSNKRFIDLF